MQPKRTSIWSHDSNKTASGKPGTLHCFALLYKTEACAGRFGKCCPERFRAVWLAILALLAALVYIVPAHAGDVTPTANSLSGQVWSKFTPTGNLPTTTNVTIATGQFNYSTNSATIPVAVGPTFTVMRTAGPTGVNRTVAPGTYPPGSTPATGTGFPATAPELHEFQGTGVVMLYNFSSALPTGSHVWAQDVDSSASLRYQFYDCSNALLNPSGFDYLLYSSTNQPTRSFTSTDVTLTAPAVSANEPLGAIIIRSSAVCRVDATIVAAGSSTSQEIFFSVPQPRVTLTKALGSLGRISNTDQFTVRIQSGATTLNSTTNSTSTGTGTTVTGGTGTTGSTSVTVSGTYTLSEVAAGTTVLTNYAGTISCTNTNSGSATVLPTGTGTSFSITPVDTADVISCTLSNARAVDLAVTKTNGVTSVNASGTTSYTVTVTNGGPNSTTGAILSDPAVTGLSKTSVTCSGTPGQCVTPPTVTQLQSGTFALPALASGQTYQITVNASVTATSGSVANIATIAAPSGFTDTSTGNNSATDTDSVNGVSDLSITKTNGVTSVNAGGSTSYTVTVTNGGPQSTTGAILSDPAVTGLSKSSIVCSGTPGQCSSPPSVAQLEGGTFAMPALASGQTYQITVNASVTATSGSVSNVATVAVPSGTVDLSTGNNSATDTDSVNGVSDLSITKTNSVTSLNAGTTTSYTVTVTNGGPQSTTGAILSDPAATGLSKTSVTCSGTPGQCASPPSVAQLEGGTFALPALASGQTYQITVNASITATSGNVSNVATVAAPSGTVDLSTGNNSATDTDSVNGVSDLSITKTNNAAGVSANSTTSYTITVTNGGPQSTTGAILSDPAVTGLSKTSVTCGGTPGQCITPPSVGQLEGGTFALPALASGATYQITVNANVTATSGSVSNVATVSAPSGTVDLTGSNNSATDTDPVVLFNLSAPLCPAGLSSNNIISNGSFTTGTGPSWTDWTAAAIWTGSGLATVTNDTVSGAVSQASLAGLLYGPSTSERAVVQLSARWVNQGSAGNSLSTSLGLFVAGVEYARITTPTGLGTTASVSYFNGASGNLSIVYDNTLTGWRVDLPATVASSGSISFAFTAGAGGVADDFTIDDVAVYTCTPASLTMVKSSTVFDDGVNPAFRTPGRDVTYTIQVANTAAGVTSSGSIFVYDTLPTQVTFFNGDTNGSAPGTDAVIFTDGGSGLIWTLASDLAYSNSVSAPTSFAACTYTPSAGYDPNVRHICVNPKGVMAAKTGSPTPAFTLTLRALIK